MENERKFALLQNIYAASLAENVNTYERIGVLTSIVAKKKERQKQSAPVINQQLEVKNIEDVFVKLAEVFGCANWAIEKTTDGYVAEATKCKLCALTKKMGGADPCRGWCLDPMFAMVSAVSGIGEENMKIESTLMDGSCCKVIIKEP